MSNKIDLTKLSPEQLQAVQKQISEELSHFQQSMEALVMAKNKFQECIANIEAVSTTPENTSMLVPLSSSLYVPGKVKDNSKFLVDVGTGYFVEKDAKTAKEFYQKKIDKLTRESGQIRDILQEKSGSLQSITQILRIKLLERQKQKPQA